MTNSTKSTLAIVELKSEAVRLGITVVVTAVNPTEYRITLINFTANGGDSVMVVHELDSEDSMNDEANVAIHAALNNRV